MRYTLPPAPEEIPATEEELEEAFAKEQPAEEEGGEGAPRSLRPGQKGFAERLMAKYGWTKGSGLGATGSGIVKPLQVKVEKPKKRPDSEGGGFVTTGGRGKIIGSARKSEDEGKFGAMSEVIILKGMVDGLDLDAELESGNLMQEIGEECSEKVRWFPNSCNRLSNFVISLLTPHKYGTVERVYIHRDSGAVFVKFTSQLSALRVSFHRSLSLFQRYRILIHSRLLMLLRAEYLMATRSLRGSSIAKSSKMEYTSEIDTMYYYTLLMIFNGSAVSTSIPPPSTCVS